MLQGGEGCQEFARVVGDLPVQTLDLTAPTSGESHVTAVTSVIRPQSLKACQLQQVQLFPLRSERQPDQGRPGPALKRVILTLLLVR